MGFKLPGRSITSGTSAHASALKQRAYGGTKTWEEGKTASEGKLDDWVKERGKHEKGTAEYDALQNKINKSLGSEKRHGVTEKTVISEKGKRVKSTTTTPGLGREKIKGTTDKSGNVKSGKSKEFDEEGKKTSKQKFRVDKEGKISAKHKDYTQKDEKDKDIVVTTKSKEGEEDKVKSRRSRGKKVGAWLRKVTTKKNK